MNYVDTYIACTDLYSLKCFVSMFSTHMEPEKGKEAVPATDEQESQPAKGDPALWYSCVRGTADITPMVVAPIVVVSSDIGVSVVGIWAN